MKLPKLYRCKECKKEYCSYGWVQYHVKKTGHRKFKEINRKKFLE